MSRAGLIFFFIFYLSYLSFWCRIVRHTLIWYEAGKRSIPRKTGAKFKWNIFLSGILDILFFRRVFSSSKNVWIASWIFHLSFVFVVISHIRFFVYPVPSFIRFIQPLGMISGYLLPVSTLFVIFLRIFGRLRYTSSYVSRYNFFVMGLLLVISTTGFLMRHYFVPDITAIKEFLIQLITFRAVSIPHDSLFLVHFILVLLLAPYLPTHFFSAPLVLIESRKREQELRAMLHENELKSS